jgi:hypothetical protein
MTFKSEQRDRSLTEKKKFSDYFFLYFLLSAAEIAERGKRKNFLKIFSKKIIKKIAGSHSVRLRL